MGVGSFFSHFVVGYANDALTAYKFKMVCSQFQTIGKEASEMTLGDFVPGGTWAAGDTVKIFADNSAVEVTVRYVDKSTLAKLIAKFPDATVGWYSNKDTTYSNNLNSRVVPAGCGFMAYTSKAASTISIPSAL